MSLYKTKQEEFWAGKFGTEYIDRNNDKKLLSSSIMFFSKILDNRNDIKSVLEFG